MRQLSSNLLTHPEYFLQDAEINRAGAAALFDPPPLPVMAAAELKTFLADGACALDVRSNEQFAGAHVPGSVNIALSGQFASWAGTLLGVAANPVLIAESRSALAEARMRLARVGLEKVSGYLEGGVDAWSKAGLKLASLPQIGFEALREKLPNDMQVLDVRREAEWESGHIDGASWFPLDNFKVASPELAPEMMVAVQCQGGYRSTIARSLLRRSGFHKVVNVTGGFDAWQKAELPIVRGKPVSA